MIDARKISELPETNIMKDSSCMPIVQDGETKKIYFSDLKWLFKGDKGEPGEKGEKGDTGVSIDRITVEESNVDEGKNKIIILKDNGQAVTFIIRNGSKGEKGDTGAVATVVQNTGDSLDNVMSQNAVSEQLSKLKSDLDNSNANIEYHENVLFNHLFNAITLSKVSGKFIYVNANNPSSWGNESSYQYYYHSQVISVKPNDKIKVTGKSETNAPVAVLYDENYNEESRHDSYKGYLGTINGTTNHNNELFTIPSGVYYVIFNLATSVLKYERTSEKKSDKYFALTDVSFTRNVGLVSKGSLNVYNDSSREWTSIDVVSGEEYKVTCGGVNTDYTNAFFVLTDGSKLATFSSYGQVTEEIIYVPDNATKLYLNGLTRNSIQIKKFIEYSNEVIYGEISDIKEKEKSFYVKYEAEQLERRLLKAEKGNDFAWSEFDKPYFVFIHDDANDYLSTFATVFENNNAPLGCAVIPNAVTSEKKTILERVVANGGEILAHYSGSPTDSTLDEDWLKYTRDIKIALENLGFNPRGLIRADSTQAHSNKGEKYCRKYFEYANVGMGISTQYDIPRTLMLNFNSLSSFKAQLDSDSLINGIHAYGFHGGRSDEAWITSDSMAEIIMYIKSKGNCVITTYSELFDKFGSTILLERIKALENA